MASLLPRGEAEEARRDLGESKNGNPALGPGLPYVARSNGSRSGKPRPVVVVAAVAGAAVAGGARLLGPVWNGGGGGLAGAGQQVLGGSCKELGYTRKEATVWSIVEQRMRES